MANAPRKTVKSNPLDSIASRRKNTDAMDVNPDIPVVKIGKAAKKALVNPPVVANAEPAQEPAIDPTSKPTPKPALKRASKPTTKPTTKPTAKPTSKPKKVGVVESMTKQDSSQSAAPTQSEKVTAQPGVDPVTQAIPAAEPLISAEEVLQREFRPAAMVMIPADLLDEDPLVDIHALHAVKSWSQWSVLAGLIPTPIVDTVAITGVQIKMIHALCELYNVEFKKEAALAVVSGLVGGTLSTSLAGLGTMLLGHLPVIGSLMKYTAQPALSYASTYALGRVFMRHFEDKGTMTDIDSKKLATYFKEQYARGRKMFKYEFKTQRAQAV